MVRSVSCLPAHGDSTFFLPGVSATAEIRRFDSMKPSTKDLTHIPLQPTRILALTGMSSLEDKRRAFEAGVDG